MAFDIPRLFRHLFARRAQDVFPPAMLDQLAARVADGETRHRGELCFAVEHALPPMAILRGHSARDRAHAAFAQLRVWDTERNTGVLVYLLLADRRIEIVADRGLDGRIDAAAWREVCSHMEARLASGDAEGAATTAVAEISGLLAIHVPRLDGADDRDELPNRPRLL